MGYALGVDLGGRSMTVAFSMPDDATPRTVTVTPAPVERLLERLGDPLDAAGTEPAHVTVAELVAARVAEVATREGASARAVVVAHPATWGPYRTGLLLDALARHDLPPVTLVPDAAVLAAHGARSSSDGPDTDGLIAVLDVREEQLAVTVVRAPAPGRVGEVVGTPRRLRELGGADVDDAVLAHVLDLVTTDGSPAARRLDRPAATALRTACRSAAEVLLTGTPATVRWTSAEGAHEVRVVPAELDARLRPRITRAVAAAAAAVAVAAPGGVSRVLLAGRPVALPLVAELVAERFEAPIDVVAGDDHAAAVGAATAAWSVAPAPPVGRGDVPARHAGARVGSSRGRRARPRPAGRRSVRAAALAGTGAVALGILAFAVSEDAFAAGGRAAEPPGAPSVSSTAPLLTRPWASAPTGGPQTPGALGPWAGSVPATAHGTDGPGRPDTGVASRTAPDAAATDAPPSAG